MGNIVFLPNWANYTLLAVVAIILIVMIVKVIVIPLVAKMRARIVKLSSSMAVTSEKHIEGVAEEIEESRKQLKKWIAMARKAPLTVIGIAMIATAFYTFAVYGNTIPTIVLILTLVGCTLVVTFTCLGFEEKLTLQIAFVVILSGCIFLTTVLMFAMNVFCALIWLVLFLFGFGYYSLIMKKEKKQKKRDKAEMANIRAKYGEDAELLYIRRYVINKNGRSYSEYWTYTILFSDGGSVEVPYDRHSIWKACECGDKVVKIGQEYRPL